MTDITVRKSQPVANQNAFALTRDIDPFRSMRDLLQRWDPFQEMTPLWNSDFQQNFSPAFEVKETNESYLFKADVPGVKEADIDVTITGSRLTISGQRNDEKEEKGETYYSCERKYGVFTRSYTLPEGADWEHVHADLKAGVLTVAVPKLPAIQPKKVLVKSMPTKA
jgi:HSP20 family protein